MYSLTDLETVDATEFDEDAPTRFSLVNALETESMRPSVWEYERGEESTYHRQGEQEELYVVLEGTVDVTIERDDERDRITLTRGEFLAVPPESWRQLEAVEQSRVLVVGAPNVPDDGVLEGEARSP